MDLGLKGKVALVTGADSGIGEQTARLLLQEGVVVAISDRPGGQAKASAEKLAALGRAIAIEADVTDTAAVAAMVAEVGERLGAPDILVHCAGVTGATGDFLEVDDDGWRETLDINLMGAVRVCRAAIPAMRAKRWGRVVLIASEDAVQPYVDELAYCASKAGVLNLAKGSVQGLRLRQRAGEQRQPRLHRDAHDRQDDGKARREEGRGLRSKAS